MAIVHPHKRAISGPGLSLTRMRKSRQVVKLCTKHATPSRMSPDQGAVNNVKILIEKSRRPRRWAGVAVLAGLIAVPFCLDTRAPVAHGPLDMTRLIQPHQSFAGALGMQDTPVLGDYSAQDTDFAFNSSVSTAGEMPTR